MPALTTDLATAAILLAATLGFADICVSSCWSMCHDIGGASAGTVNDEEQTANRLLETARAAMRAIEHYNQPAMFRLCRAIA